MENFNLRDEFENVVGRIIEFLPNILAALLILLIGALIATLLASIVKKVLKRLRFDRAVHQSPAGSYVSRVVESPAHFTSRVVYWLVMIGVISLAIAALNLPLLNDFLAAIYGYVPNIIAAVIIFLVATTVSAVAVTFTQRVMGKSALSKLISAAIPAVVMSLAVFMILNQLGIAEDIVNILFTAIVGSIGLGLALAFGLGGRDVAKGLLEQAADSVRSKKDDIKSEVSSATTNARRMVK